jgi:hypothetical protein
LAGSDLSVINRTFPIYLTPDINRGINYTNTVIEMKSKIVLETKLPPPSELWKNDVFTPNKELVVLNQIGTIRGQYDWRRTVNPNKVKTITDGIEHFNENVDVVFIDADHNFESVKKDFKNSLKLLNKHGMIILHDTDPMEEMYLNPNYCGDSYKMDEWIRENYTDLDIMTLPLTQAGLTIVKRKSDKRVNNFLK